MKERQILSCVILSKDLFYNTFSYSGAYKPKMGLYILPVYNSVLGL